MTKAQTVDLSFAAYMFIYFIQYSKRGSDAAGVAGIECKLPESKRLLWNDWNPFLLMVQ